MKRKQLPKSLFLSLALFSLFSFAFVNLQPHADAQSCQSVKPGQTQIEECEESKAREIPIPDLTVVGRLLELAEKFFQVSN